MVSPFLTRLRTGNATRAYPHAPEAAPELFRGQLLLDTTKCSGEAACTAVCPASAITVTRGESGWTWELTDARCVFCGLCAEACPTAALSFSTDYELAVRDAGDLVTRVTFGKQP